MEKDDIYSKGFHGIVRRVNERDPFVGAADLVKEEDCKDPHYFARQYYALKIAEALFPDSFIKVVGATRAIKEQEVIFHDMEGVVIPATYTNRLYSKQADVPRGHAVYAKHMISEERMKRSTCECDVCKIHRKYHEIHHLEERAANEAKIFSESGVMVPSDDSSDYCLGENGLLYFEIVRLDRHLLREQLKDIPKKDETIRLVLHFFDRYQSLFALSRQKMLTGSSHLKIES